MFSKKNFEKNFEKNYLKKKYFFQKFSKVSFFSGHFFRRTDEQTNERTECLNKLLVAAKKFGGKLFQWTLMYQTHTVRAHK